MQPTSVFILDFYPDIKNQNDLSLHFGNASELRILQFGWYASFKIFFWGQVLYETMEPRLKIRS